MQQGSNLTW